MDKPVLAADLPALPPVMEQVENACHARHVKFEDFLKLFDESVHGKIRGAALGPGITHVVCMENLDFWSSQHGHRTALVVGDRPEGAEIPTWTLENVLRTPYFRLGATPSRFQYAVAYASVKPVAEELPQQEQSGEVSRG